jgi:hypothetical protein
MFTEGRSAKYRTGIMDFQHSSHTGVKIIQLHQTVEEVSVKFAYVYRQNSFP